MHQLRAVPPDFVGREAEITAVVQQILAQPTPGHAAISAISSVNGLAGIGKTELANLAAHALASQFPDAQLFVPLAAHSSAPRTARQAMEFCLTSFEPEVKTPDEDALLRAAYVSAFQGKRCLLLLDDARDDEHIALLLPPPGCAVIVTSRARLACSRLDPLDTLPPDQAADLLRRLCPRLSPAEAAELARLCGCLPIALSVAGGHLNKNRSEPPEEIMRKLSGPEPLKNLKLGQLDVQAVFEASCAALAPEQKAGFRALAVMPAGFDRAAALAVVGGPAEAAAIMLDEMVGRNLLGYDDKTRRFRWHDLLREFARNHAKPDELEAAKRRHAEHFTRIASEAERLYKQGGEDVVRSLALVDRERGHLEVAVDWLEAKSDKNSAPLLVSLVNALVYFGSLRFHPQQRIRWMQAQAKAARLTGDRTSEGNALGSLGRAYLHTGNPRKAIEFCEKWLTVAREIGDHQGEGQALGNLGTAYHLLGFVQKAVEFHQQRLAIASQGNNLRSEGAALRNLGLAYVDLRDVRRAVELYERALGIARKIGDRRGEGMVLCNLGAADIALGDPRKGIGLFEQAMDIAREIRDRRGEGNALANLGNAYANLGDARKALELYEQAILIRREIGEQQAEGDAMWNSAKVLKMLEDRVQAIARAQAALEIYEATESPAVGDVRAALARWKAGL